VTPDDGVYLRGRDGLTDAEVDEAVREAKAEAAALDLRLARARLAQARADRAAGGTGTA
jgi:hypothetical protein